MELLEDRVHELEMEASMEGQVHEPGSEVLLVCCRLAVFAADLHTKVVHFRTLCALRRSSNAPSAMNCSLHHIGRLLIHILTGVEIQHFQVHYVRTYHVSRLHCELV